VTTRSTSLPDRRYLTRPRAPMRSTSCGVMRSTRRHARCRCSRAAKAKRIGTFPGGPIALTEGAPFRLDLDTTTPGSGARVSSALRARPETHHHWDGRALLASNGSLAAFRWEAFSDASASVRQSLHFAVQVSLAFEANPRKVGQGHIALFHLDAVRESTERLEQVGIGFVAAEA
jgi:hypothetical protein